MQVPLKLSSKMNYFFSYFTLGVSTAAAGESVSAGAGAAGVVSAVAAGVESSVEVPLLPEQAAKANIAQAAIAK